MPFPDEIDDLRDPQGDTIMGTFDHALLHREVNAAVEALQAKVGIDGSADADSLDYKVRQAVGFSRSFLLCGA